MKMKENLLMIFFFFSFFSYCWIHIWYFHGFELVTLPGTLNVCASSVIFWCKEINIYEVTVVRSSPEYQTTSFRFTETSSRHSYANRWCVFEMNPENKIKVNSSREYLWNLAETRNEEKWKVFLPLGSKC